MGERSELSGSPIRTKMRTRDAQRTKIGLYAVMDSGELRYSLLCVNDNVIYNNNLCICTCIFCYLVYNNAVEKKVRRPAAQNIVNLN